MEYGVWNLVPGTWCLVHGVWNLVYGIWCMVQNALNLVYGICVFGIWCVEFGVEYGMQNMVYGM